MPLTVPGSRAGLGTRWERSREHDVARDVTAYSCAGCLTSQNGPKRHHVAPPGTSLSRLVVCAASLTTGRPAYSPTRGAAHELPERSPPEGGGPSVGRGRPHASSICGRTCALHSARLTGAGEPNGRRPVAGAADSRCVRTSTAMLGPASELPRPDPGDQPGRLHVPGWHYTLDQHDSAAPRPFTQPAQRNAVADSPPHAQGLVAPMVLQLLASW